MIKNTKKKEDNSNSVIVKKKLKVISTKKAGPKARHVKNESINLKNNKTNKESKNNTTNIKSRKKIIKHIKIKHSKKYRSTLSLIDSNKTYNIIEAIKIIKKISYVKFDASVEVHFKLGVDLNLNDHLIRGNVSFPYNIGKQILIAALVNPNKVVEAKEAGADFYNENEIIDMLENEKYKFNILIITPDMMVKIAKFAKTLGPKGLMPNPKSGNITQSVGKLIKIIKSGRVEFRVDQQGIIHQVIGKVSYDNNKLILNYNTLHDAIFKLKPNNLKKQYIESIYIKNTMGPAIKINPSDRNANLKEN